MTDQPTLGPSERSVETKTRILDAALREFSANGLAGARMDRIAASASVNKALIYYYFESKDNLYIAALEMISAKIRDRSMALFLLDASPGERLLRTALDHFDRILAQGEFQSLMQQEMMRLRLGETGAIAIVVKRVFAPLQAMYQSTVREGISSGELIDADWMQIHLAALGANVFYFLSAPVWEMLLPYDPLSPEALIARRRAVVEFLGKAVFTDRNHGAEVAARVLADTPVPEMENRLFFGRSNERKK
jgi:TetR/AcrR family transcriptional regulator